MASTSDSIIQKILDSSTGGFPPSFEGNPWIFGMALFCTMVASLVSIMQIYFITKEIKELPDKKTSPLNIYRYQLWLCYLIVLFAVAPDSVYLWTYGEVDASTTSTLLNIDRLFDSLFLVPFGMFTWLQLRCGAVLRYQLITRAATAISVQPDKSALKLNGLVAIIILIMSIAVTISK